jgi:hypothetical protein
MPPDEDTNTALTQGWGESVLTTTLDAITNADSTAGNIASLVLEAKIDIIRIPDFMAWLNNESYRSKIIERYSLATMSKGINERRLSTRKRTGVQEQECIACRPDWHPHAFMQIVSGAAFIPVTRLLGQSPAGMNATGTSDRHRTRGHSTRGRIWCVGQSPCRRWRRAGSLCCNGGMRWAQRARTLGWGTGRDQTDRYYACRSANGFAAHWNVGHQISGD